MIDRYLKTSFVAALALFALIAAGDNIVNLEAAHGAVGYVLGQADHVSYPKSILPALGPVAAWVVLAVICICELTASLLCFIAASHLVKARKDPVSFAQALPFARLAAGSFALVWFVLFWVFGVAGYVMWQTPVGAESATSAFRISAFGFFVLIYLGQREDSLPTT